MSATKTFEDREAMPMLLKLGMAFLTFYTVEQIHFPQSLGVPGLNVLNLICLIVWISHLRTGRKNNVRPILRKRLLLLFAMTFYAFLIAQASVPGNVVEDINYLKASIFYPMFFFIFFYIVRTEGDIRFIVYVCLFVAMLAGFEALREGLAFGVTSFNDMKRASGPFGDDFFTANRAGIFYAMFVCLAVAMALYHPEPGNRWIRPFAILSTVIILGGMYFTFSRQAYIIAGLIVPLMFFKRGPALIVIALIAALNYQLWVPEAAVNRLTDTKQANEDGVEQVDDSTSSRWVQWEAGWEMIKDKPWGVGFQRFQALSGSYGGKPNLDAHNHYVLFATEASPIGLFVHMVLVLSLWWYGHSYYRLAKRRKNPLGRALGTGFAFMSLAMILGNIYGSPFSNGEVMGLYWVLAGLMARHMILLQHESMQPRPDMVPVGQDDDGLEVAAIKKRPRRRAQSHPGSGGPLVDLPVSAMTGGRPS